MAWVLRTAANQSIKLPDSVSQAGDRVEIAFESEITPSVGYLFDCRGSHDALLILGANSTFVLQLILSNYEIDGISVPTPVDGQPISSSGFDNLRGKKLSFEVPGGRYATALARYSNVSTMLVDISGIKLIRSGVVINHWSVEGTDKNQSSVLTDIVGGQNASLVNMTGANWVNLGGDGIVETLSQEVTLSGHSTERLELSESNTHEISTSYHLTDSLNLTENYAGISILSYNSSESLNDGIEDGCSESLSLSGSSAEILEITEQSILVTSLTDRSFDNLAINEPLLTVFALSSNSSDSLVEGVSDSFFSELSLSEFIEDGLSITDTYNDNLSLVDNSLGIIINLNIELSEDAIATYIAPSNIVTYTAPSNITEA